MKQQRMSKEWLNNLKVKRQAENALGQNFETIMRKYAELTPSQRAFVDKSEDKELAMNFYQEA